MTNDSRGLRAWVEVDLGAIERNYLSVMSRLPQGAEAIAVVKSNAYGHGDVAVAEHLYRCGVRRFAVANLDEAITVSQALPHDAKILILGYTPPYTAADLAARGFCQALISLDYARELAVYADSANVRVKCHLAADTGMRRVGIYAAELAEFDAVIGNYGRWLNVEGVFTHLSSADSGEFEDVRFTRGQLMLFSALATHLERYGIRDFHCLNSAGIIHYSSECDTRLSKLVRPGLTLYGLLPSLGSSADFLPALSFKSVVAMVKDVPPGASVGYGRSYRTEGRMRIATVPVGYADGYPRALSNRGSVLIRGRSVPIVGRVCMNQFTLDVTDIPGVAPGDEVVLIGRCGEEKICADRLAELCGTISYEIISGIDRAVPRRYI